MSEFKEFVEGSVSDVEIQMVMAVMGRQMVMKNRVMKKLNDLMRGVEERDYTISSIIMSAEDWAVIRARARDEFNISTDMATMRMGIMGTYCGVIVMVQRGFKEMVAVPNIEKAVGCLMVFQEEEV